MSLGTVLRNARESKGLTIDQVAEQTRLIRQIVEDLEKDDFHRIVASVYGCGFIKLYAECVGVDPVPLQQEFREVYSGFRRPNIQTRAVNTPPERPAAPAPSARPAAPTPPKVRAVPLAKSDEPVAEEAPQAAAPAAESPNAAAAAVAAFFASRKKEPTLASAPVREETPAAPQVKDEAPAEPAPAPMPQEAEPAVAPVEVAPVEIVADEAPVVAPVPSEEPVAEPIQEPETSASDSIGEDQPKQETVSEPPPAEAADSVLGELFAASRRPKQTSAPLHFSNESEEPQKAGAHAKANDHSKAEPSEHRLNIPVTTQAPSWDDKPFQEPLPSWLQYVKVKTVAAVLAGLVILAIAIFGIALASRPKAPADGNGEQVVSAKTEISRPASSDGSALFREKVLPPTDCYVD